MKAREHTLSMIEWWKDAGVSRADLAVQRSDGAMLWHRDLHLDDLPLPWARAENTRHGNVFIRPARGYPWPLVFLDDVAEDLASRIARKYDALVVKTSQEGGCHIWLSCACSLDECERHQAQRWLAPLAGADIASISGEHLGRLAGFKNWKRNGPWVNVVAASCNLRRWLPRAGNDKPFFGAGSAPLPCFGEPSRTTDTSPSGVEWGWVCGMLEAGLPPHLAYYRLVERARKRRGPGTERYARYTVGKALARTRQAGFQT
jgi:hypothetical protein